MFNPTMLNINPNPVNGDKVELNFSGDEEGTHTLTFYNIQGIKIETIQWENQRNANKSFMLDLKKYSDGVYYIILKTPWSLISKPLTIVK